MNTLELPVEARCQTKQYAKTLKEVHMAAIPSKYMDAQSVEEVAQLLKEDDRDDALAERTWEEICHVREQIGDNLSMDELEAVAGGSGTRDWWKSGCAATVEPGSSCWGTDGGCSYVNIHYWTVPGTQSCIYCGAKYTYTYGYSFPDGSKGYEYGCRECGKWFTYNKYAGEWQECMSRIMNK